MDLYVKVLQNLNQEQIQFATFVFLFGFGVVAPQFGLYLWVLSCVGAQSPELRVLSCVGAQSPEDKGLAENRLDGPGVAIRLFRSVSNFRPRFLALFSEQKCVRHRHTESYKLIFGC